MLRVLIEVRKTDESVVRAIFSYVLPLAIVAHCWTASTLFEDLHSGYDYTSNYTVTEAFNPFMRVMHDLSNAGEAAQQLITTGNISTATAALEIYEDEANVIVRWSFYVNGGLAFLFLLREVGRAWFSGHSIHDRLERTDPLALLDTFGEEQLADVQEKILNTKIGFKIGGKQVGFQVGVRLVEPRLP